MLLPQNRNGAVFDKLVGPADANDWRVDHLGMEMFHHTAAEAVVKNMILNRAQHMKPSSEKFQRAGVDRLDPAGIDERNGKAQSLQLSSRVLRHFKHVAKTKYRDVLTVLHHLGFADFEQFVSCLRLRTGSCTARITDSDW